MYMHIISAECVGQHGTNSNLECHSTRKGGYPEIAVDLITSDCFLSLRKEVSNLLVIVIKYGP